MGRDDGADHAARPPADDAGDRRAGPRLGAVLRRGHMALLFVAGAPWRHFAALGALFAVAIALVLVAAPMAEVQVLEPYQVEPPDIVPAAVGRPGDEGYQQHQALIAMGSGRRPAAGRGRDADVAQLPARASHRLHLRRGRRDLRVRRLRADSLAVCATYMARASHPDRREELAARCSPAASR